MCGKFLVVMESLVDPVEGNTHDYKEKAMNCRLIITLGLLVYIVLGSVVVAQPVHLPDPNLREPRTVMLEGGTDPSEPPDSPYNPQLMRAITTMSLTHSDGYVLFEIGRGHVHYWYDFWDADLGRPVGSKFQFYEEIEQLYIREFTNGWAVYNQSGGAQVVTLPDEVQSVANGLVNTEHAVLNIDSDIFFRTASKNPGDVNGDGIVNVFDLAFVANAF